MASKSIDELIIDILENISQLDENCQIQERNFLVDEHEKPEQIDNYDGTVEIKDGKIVVKNPTGLGKYPTISPGPGVKVLANGKLMKTREIVTESTQLEVIIKNIEPNASFKISISEDKLEAYCTVEFSKGKKYRLVDQDAENQIVLKVEVVEEVHPSAISLKEIQDKLTLLGIKCGVVFDELETELKNPTGNPVVIARGVPPISSQDSWVEYLFETDKRKYEPQGKERIDYLEHGQFQTVEAGTILAIKHPPVPGKPGLTIDGTEIPAGNIKDVEINTGIGVTLVEGGRKAVATADGRPVMKGTNKIISVLSQLTISGDVDISTGHIRFNGDVLIRGNVTEGLIVHATGRITVLGNVYSANIIAGENILVNRNVVSSKLYAGGTAAFFNRILPVFKQLQLYLNGIDTAVKQLKNNKMFLMQDLKIKGDGNLIKLLIDAKFREITKLIEYLDESVKSAVYKLEPVIMIFVESARLKLTGTGPLTIGSMDELTEMQQQLAEIIRLGEEYESATANVSMSYVQNSIVEATGSLQVFGQGSYQTNMYAGKDVEISGVCRGGDIHAGGNIKVSGLGSSSLVLTKVKVNEQSIITASKVFPNVHIKVGPQAFKIDQFIENFKCCWDRQEGLLISSR